MIEDGIATDQVLVFERQQRYAVRDASGLLFLSSRRCLVLHGSLPTHSHRNPDPIPRPIRPRL
jgi:hypothetical protein